MVNSRRYAGDDGADTVYALRDGDVLWQREYRHYIGIRCPGDGYLYVLQKERGEKYSPIHIERVDADGSVLLSRTLSADRLVLSCGFTFQSDSGRLMIFGHGVAVSRDQYNVFVMDVLWCSAMAPISIRRNRPANPFWFRLMCWKRRIETV